MGVDFRLMRCAAPHETENRYPMHFGGDFILGDPHTERNGSGAVYDTTGEPGSVNWTALFTYLLSICVEINHFQCIYVLVDTRDHSDISVTGRDSSLASCCRVLGAQGANARTSGRTGRTCICPGLL